MEESDTYQAILEAGAIRQARKMVLQLGQEKFGPAGDDVLRALQLDRSPLDQINDIVMARKSMEELERLARLRERIVDVSSWQDLLQMS